MTVMHTFIKCVALFNSTAMHISDKCNVKCTSYLNYDRYSYNVVSIKKQKKIALKFSYLWNLEHKTNFN